MKQGKLPPGTGHSTDLRDCIEGWKLQKSSQEGGSASHQASYKVANPKNMEGVGRHRGRQSSSLHRRISQGPSGPPPYLGPSRPLPLSTVTSASLASTTLAHDQARGPKGVPGQGKKQPGERDQSQDKQVGYLSAGVFRYSFAFLPIY